MYCKNCGQDLENNHICPNCGIRKGEGSNYCPDCGESVSSQNATCAFCGGRTQQRVAGSKSRIVAGLLGIFLGSFGVHNFYLGYFGKGMLQLLLSLISCGMLAGVVEIWAIIEGVLLLTGGIEYDAQGIPLH